MKKIQERRHEIGITIGTYSNSYTIMVNCKHQSINDLHVVIQFNSNRTILLQILYEGHHRNDNNI